ncbi:alpha/beta fold hydrolase [Salinarimonas soli]|uniref:alpha/beta fold hydrolase n=1 Tax=Salinarimonas soli TaxID=1638099 RepID=UPI001F0A8B9B|nr:alpha/beta fold hydrolase [Salinarimonas soli]
MQIVLLPGLLCDESVFAHQVEALRPYANAVVANLSEDDSITGMAERALALRDGPLVVIGHSMGARAALEMARLAPQRVARLVLMDTGAHPRREGEEVKRQALIDLADREGMAALAERWLPPMVHEDRVGDDALMAPLRAMVMRATPAQHARQIRALLNRPDARPLLPAIECPTLVMVGRQDRWSPLAQHEEIAAAIPDATLVVIEDSGHMAPVEQPRAVTDALLAWLGFPDAKDRPMDAPDRIPDIPLFDRQRQLKGYRLNKMAMGLAKPENRDAFRADEGAYLDRFGLTPEEKRAVMARDWREMVRLGGNVFFILKISAIDPARMTEIGAHQAGMDHDAFLRERLGKR